MRSYITPIACLALAACTSACTVRVKGVDGNGDFVAENRAVQPFSRVVLRAPLVARIREGGDQAVTLWIDSNLRQMVTTTVANGTLVIDTTGVIYPEARATLDIRVPKIEGMSIEGSGDAVVTAPGAHPKVELSTRGSGDLEFKGNADEIDAENSGTGALKLSGAANRLVAEVHGKGDIDARGLPAVGGRFEVDGSGDILANLRGGDIACKVLGSGDIRWVGSARVTSIDRTGSGTVGQL